MEKCNDSHKKELLELLKPIAAENCFLYGDIENFNLDSDFMDVYRIVKDGITTSIILRYYTYFVVYTTDTDDYPMIAEVINKYENCSGISGLEKTVNDLAEYIEFKNIKNMYLAELNRESFREYNSSAEPVKATVGDLDDLFDFQSGIEEFNLTENQRESYGNEVKSNTGRIYFFKKDDKIISTATITAENSLNGMIIGVATDKNHRRKGYAKACVGKLCKEMVTDNKSVLLFYDNPDAGKLYKDLGFKDINRWSMGIK